jgi:hypothetical protein
VCCVCHKRQTRKIFKCPKCKVGLCFAPCLKVFHTKSQFSDQLCTGKTDYTD